MGMRTNVPGSRGKGFKELRTVAGVGGGGAALIVQAAHRSQVLAVLEHFEDRLRLQLGALDTAGVISRSQAQRCRHAFGTAHLPVGYMSNIKDKDCMG